MKFLKKLQTKPRYIRIQILWISVILIMLIIFSLWTVYLKSSLSYAEEKTKQEIEKQSVPSLFSSLKNDFSLLKNKLKAGVNGIIQKQESGNKFEVEIIK